MTVKSGICEQRGLHRAGERFIELPLLLTEGQFAGLETEAARTGETIGGLLRRLVASWLAESGERG